MRHRFTKVAFTVVNFHFFDNLGNARPSNAEESAVSSRFSKSALLPFPSRPRIFRLVHHGYVIRVGKVPTSRHNSFQLLAESDLVGRSYLLGRRELANLRRQSNANGNRRPNFESHCDVG